MNYDSYLYLLIKIIIVWIKLDCIFYCLQKVFNNNLGKSLMVTIAFMFTLSSEHFNLIGLCCFYINITDIILL
jgi:hypothetical protein